MVTSVIVVSPWLVIIAVVSTTSSQTTDTSPTEIAPSNSLILLNVTLKVSLFSY